MKRRTALQIIVGATLLPYVPAQGAIFSEPRTAQELTEAINRLFDPIGSSIKAYEDIDGRRWVHQTYGLMTGLDDGSEKRLVQSMWHTCIGIRAKVKTPRMVWRRTPTYETWHDFDTNEDLAKLTMRVSFDRDYSLYKEGYPWTTI